MAAGLAGLRELWTPAAIDTLNRRGERLRERCNALFAARGLALQCSGLGSLMTLHATDRPLRCAADLAGSDPRIKDLLFFALLERGVFMARRGMVALSLPFGDAEVEQFVAALDDVLRSIRPCCPPRRAADPGRHRPGAARCCRPRGCIQPSAMARPSSSHWPSRSTTSSSMKSPRPCDAVQVHARLADPQQQPALAHAAEHAAAARQRLAQRRGVGHRHAHIVRGRASGTSPRW